MQKGERSKPVPNLRLKHERELRSWSQADLAARIGAANVSIGRWERGEMTPDPTNRQRLCELFGKSPVELGFLAEDNPKSEEAQHQQDEPNSSPLTAAISSGAATERIFDTAIPVSPLLGSLVGRDELLARLKNRLRGNKSAPLAALNGLPGVGKTALALELAHDEDMKKAFQGGVLWAGLGPKPNIAGFLSHWGTLLGLETVQVSSEASIGGWAEAIRAAIGIRRMLIILDDVWRIEDALALKVGGPYSAHLVTTRFPEVALYFTDDGAIGVHELTETHGVSILARLAPEIVSQEWETARKLVELVGGLPLALNIMGKYLQVQGFSGQPRRIQAAIRQLQHAKDRLELSGPGARSLLAVIETSVQHLDELSRNGLYALSVFSAKPGSFSEEAALTVCDVSPEVLDNLTNAGLLEGFAAGRYTLHQTITDYSRTKRNDMGPELRMVTYFADFVAENERNFAVLEQESSNLGEALQLAFDRQMLPSLIKMANSFAYFLRNRGQYTLAEKHLIRAREAARSLNDSPGLAIASLHLGRIVMSRGEYILAESTLQEGLQESRRAEQPDITCAMLEVLGKVAEQAGKYEQAKVYLLAGLELANRLGDKGKMCSLLAILGGVYRLRGKYSKAEQYLQESKRLADELGLLETTCSLLLMLGAIETSRGDFAKAESYLIDSLQLARSLSLDGITCASLALLAALENSREDYSQAERYLQEGFSLAERLGLHKFGTRERLGFLLFNLSLEIRKGRPYRLTHEAMQEDLELVSQFRHRELISMLFSNLSIVELNRGQYTKAAENLREALNLARAIENRWLVGELLCITGECHLKQQQWIQASTVIQDALKTVPPAGLELLAIAHFGMARVLLAQGNAEGASQEGQKSLSLFTTIGHHRTHAVSAWLAQLPS